MVYGCTAHIIKDTCKDKGKCATLFPDRPCGWWKLIPYIPEPTCPECKHPLSEIVNGECQHDTGRFGYWKLCHCRCSQYPADLQPKEQTDELPLLAIKGYTHGWPRFEIQLDKTHGDVEAANKYLKDYGYMLTKLIPVAQPIHPEKVVEKHCTSTKPCFLSDAASESVCCWCPSWQPVEPAEKPPLGLMPRLFHDKGRMEEIAAAAQRYMEAGKQIPHEWIKEYAELCNKYEWHEKH